MNLSPGLHTGVSFADYYAIDAASHSTLKLLRNGVPADVKYHLDRPDDRDDDESAALRDGRALHAMLLEPDSRLVVCGPDRNRNAKEWKDFEAQNNGVLCLKPDEYLAVERQVQAIMANDIAYGLLFGKTGTNESTMLWQDDGLWCKGRLDRIAEFDGFFCIADVKSMADIGDHAATAAVTRYGYHCQGAWYLRGLNHVSPNESRRRYFIIGVSKRPPYHCRVFEIDAESLDAGARIMERCWHVYRECKRTGDWPGYETEGIVSIGVQGWALQES